jgi:4-hydroxy-tetrahydrodipicolinate reductase
MIRVGLVGYGKAGRAVASVLRGDPRFELVWIARRTERADATAPDTPEPLVSLQMALRDEWLDQHPIDALVDFSAPEAVLAYRKQVKKHAWMLVSAISAYTPAQLRVIKGLGKFTRVLSSPNVTVGINYLILAAKLLRTIAPHADIAIVEQHFRAKPEVSGTARKIAEHLALPQEQVTSLRLGGIVGRHEVIFGFPYQTVRLVHESIQREAFGTGVAFALKELEGCAVGFYRFEDLLMSKIRQQLLAA